MRNPSELQPLSPQYLSLWAATKPQTQDGKDQEAQAFFGRMDTDLLIDEALSFISYAL